MSLRAPESSDSEPTPEDVPLDAFESDSNFAAAAIQLMGHFLAQERIPPPALALDTEAEDGVAEEIEDLQFTLPISKYPLFLEKRMLGAFTVMDLSGIGSSFDADAQARVVMGMGTVYEQMACRAQRALMC